MAILIRPLINEKSMLLIKQDFYTFQIDKNASKKDVAKQVKDRFNVEVLSVQTLNLGGKQKMQASRKGYYRTSPFKKAIVRIKNGQRIALFEVSEPEEEVKVKTAEGEAISKTKEKKSLLRGTKVKIERDVENPATRPTEEEKPHPTEKMHTQQGGKTRGEK